MRTFLGIGVARDPKQSISSVKDEFRRTDADIKYVKDENLHWTVKFLGDVKEDEIQRIDTVKDVVSDREPFEVELSGVGVFPSLDYIKVIWVGAGDGRSKMKDMIDSVDARLSDAGFEGDEKETVPHVTIGRMKSGRNKEEVRETIKRLKGHSFGTMKVGSITLYSSELTPEGPIYETLKEFELNG
ncbi:MAG: RNA 2',3'-cyclic phosphodiesterase [Candidatus Aenigmatarchaeota archaeon]